MPIGITAVGAYLPPDVIDNATIAQWTGADPDWVVERTGYIERRYAPPGTATSDLAESAVRDLLTDLPLALSSVRGVILATSTPDQPQPATAVALADRLNLDNIPAFDLNAVCAGWLYGLVVGAALAAQPGTGPDVLVVGADMYSRVMDRTDRATVALFGDGAGATLLSPVPDGFGLLSCDLVAHPKHRELVEIVGGGTRRPLTTASLAAGEDQFRMKGRLVREYVLDTLPRTIQAALDAAGLAVCDIDRFVFHQANLRLLADLAKALDADPTRVAMTPRYGNCGAASIPVALRETQRERPIQRGELLLFAGVGGGMTAGAAVVRWH
jgi:acetoacetyl-CoA synthase